MKIALDFDETITLDPEFWGAFIRLARASEHTVTIVTYRSSTGDNLDIERFGLEWNVPIVYTNGAQKAEAVDADVWIDDSPEHIPRYCAYHPEESLHE